MTDDIVTRLRDNCACSGTQEFGYTCTSCKAADEIECLRVSIDGMSKLVKSYDADRTQLRTQLLEWKEFAYQVRNKYWWAMGRKTLKKFDAMHKADWALLKNVALRQALKKEWGK